MLDKLHIVTMTGKIFKDGKVLIVRRALNEKNYPGRWIVPGGKLEKKDYIDLQPNSDGLWYNIIEKALKREIMEETGLEVENVDYLVDMVFMRPDGIPTVVIACTCDHKAGEVKLSQKDLIDHAWVTLEEAENYPLIDGVHDELKLAFSKKFKI